MQPVAHRLQRQRFVHIFLIDDLQHSSAELVHAAHSVRRAEAAFTLGNPERFHRLFICLMEIRIRRMLLADTGADRQPQRPVQRPAQLVDGSMQLQKARIRRQKQHNAPAAAKAAAQILPREKLFCRAKRCLAERLLRAFFQGKRCHGDAPDAIGIEPHARKGAAVLLRSGIEVAVEQHCRRNRLMVGRILPGSGKIGELLFDSAVNFNQLLRQLRHGNGL